MTIELRKDVKAVYFPYSGRPRDVYVVSYPDHTRMCRTIGEHLMEMSDEEASQRFDTSLNNMITRCIQYNWGRANIRKMVKLLDTYNKADAYRMVHSYRSTKRRVAINQECSW